MSYWTIKTLSIRWALKPLFISWVTGSQLRFPQDGVRALLFLKEVLLLCLAACWLMPHQCFIFGSCRFSVSVIMAFAILLLCLVFGFCQWRTKFYKTSVRETFLYGCEYWAPSMCELSEVIRHGVMTSVTYGAGRNQSNKVPSTLRVDGTLFGNVAWTAATHRPDPVSGGIRV